MELLFDGAWAAGPESEDEEEEDMMIDARVSLPPPKGNLSNDVFFPATFKNRQFTYERYLSCNIYICSV